jgi:hypothetical protein
VTEKEHICRLRKKVQNDTAASENDSCIYDRKTNIFALKSADLLGQKCTCCDFGHLLFFLKTARAEFKSDKK